MPGIRNVNLEDEAQDQKQAKTRKRIKILVFLTVCVVVARIFIHNPAPPPKVEKSNIPFRAIPGVLNRLSDSERSRLTPQQLAMLKEADEKAKSSTKPASMLAMKPIPLSPQKPAVDSSIPPLSSSPSTYVYSQRRIIPTIKYDSEPIDYSKATVVVFSRGGFIKAQEAHRSKNEVQIKIDRTMCAGVPGRLVESINSDSANWKQPIPAGHVELKPAKGITIIVSQKVAKRISMPKKDQNEI